MHSSFESHGLPIDVGNVDGDPSGAFIFLQMAASEIVQYIERSTTPEFRARTPKCVSDFDADGATVTVTDAGESASDLVLLDYKVVFCVDPTHQADQGFSISHAAEIKSSTDAYDTANVILPRSSRPFRLAWVAPPGVVNIYLRRSELWWNLGDAMIRRRSVLAFR